MRADDEIAQNPNSKAERSSNEGATRVEIGVVEISRERVSVLDDGEVVASFRAETLRQIAIVDGTASAHPLREASWGVTFVLIGLFKVLQATLWWEYLVFTIMAGLGVWVLINIARRVTKVSLLHDSGQRTVLGAKIRLPPADLPDLARKCAELGYRLD